MGHPGIQILLLEDQALVRAGMKELIKISEPDAYVQEAASYKEAIYQLENRRYDYAFLDIDLKSEMTGLDVLRFVRSKDIDVRAIMLSGYSGKDLLTECLNIGAWGYIPKDAENNGIFRSALDTVFRGGIFIPLGLLGENESANRHTSHPPGMSPESLGVTGRTLEVLYYLCQGFPNKTIARKMKIEEGTIRKDYVPRLFKIFKVVRRTELLVEVARRGVRFPKFETEDSVSSDSSDFA